MYGDSAPCRAVFYDWIKEGREQLEDDPEISSKKGESPPQKIKKTPASAVEKDQQITIDEISIAVGISHGSAFSILKEGLDLSKLLEHWVLKNIAKKFNYIKGLTFSSNFDKDGNK